jgi:dTDP-4-dehydrorhamnose reductase
MTWVVLGSTGLFGFDMTKTLIEAGEKVITLNRSDINLLWNPKQIVENIPHAISSPISNIVNAIAYTDVEKAEKDETTAKLVNCEFAGKLAQVSIELGARLVHISTDYVFDGRSTVPYKIEDPANPLTAYGRSKVEGEILIRESDSDYQIFRTSWLYGEHKDCFPKKIARNFLEKKPIRVVDDQFGNPTWTKDLAALVLDHSNLEAANRPKIVHAVASGQTSRFEFAVEIANSLGLPGDSVVERISSTEYLSGAIRPQFTALDNSNSTGIQIGNWRERWRLASRLVLTRNVQ